VSAFAWAADVTSMTTLARPSRGSTVWVGAFFFASAAAAFVATAFASTRAFARCSASAAASGTFAKMRVAPVHTSALYT
jgi:hypothetical protein